MHVDPKLTNYWIRNSQIPPCVIAQLHPTTTPALCNAQGQVSARCEATTICRCRSSHLRWMLHHMGICSMSTDQQLLHHIQVQRPCISTNFIELPSSCLTPEIENLVAKTIQGAVNRDLVKVNDPSLKKAPPDAVAFGSDGPSCHAST
jgi:hypothetical protein